MFGAMFIGLSGMQAYSNGLRQVSNNITNLNSTGFKSSDLVFSDLFGVGSYGLSSSDGNSHPGQGVALSDLRLNLGQGELRQSDRGLDLAVDGGGFLVLEKDGEYLYARTGNFEVNDDGYIVLSGTDYRLTVLGDDGRAQSLSIAPYRTNAPVQTTRVEFADNLSSTATEYSLADIKVYDAVGAVDNWQVSFERSETSPAGEWTVTVRNGAGEEVGVETLKFNNGVVDPATSTLSFSDGNRNVTFDFSGSVTSFSSGSVSTLRASDVDGQGVGDITDILVNQDGELEISYSNEEKKNLGPVTLAAFTDPQLLEQRTGGLFAYNSASGKELLTSASDRVGRVLSNRIEASNVDLSEQFGDLILVQRGYQVASQVVSVSNEMIQQLFGLRGQG